MKWETLESIYYDPPHGNIACLCTDKSTTMIKYDQNIPLLEARDIQDCMWYDIMGKPLGRDIQDWDHASSSIGMKWQMKVNRHGDCREKKETSSPKQRPFLVCHMTKPSRSQSKERKKQGTQQNASGQRHSPQSTSRHRRQKKKSDYVRLTFAAKHQRTPTAAHFIRQVLCRCTTQRLMTSLQVTKGIFMQMEWEGERPEDFGVSEITNTDRDSGRQDTDSTKDEPCGHQPHESNS